MLFVYAIMCSLQLEHIYIAGKPQKTIQSPDRLYKAPTDYTKLPYASACNHTPPYALFMPPNANAQDTFSPKQSKKQKQMNLSFLSCDQERKTDPNPTH